MSEILTPEVRGEISKFLLIVLPILGAVISTWWQNRKVKKDVAQTVARVEQDANAFHDVKRVIENEIGISTRWDPTTRRVDVTRTGNASGQGPASKGPQGLDQGPGA